MGDLKGNAELPVPGKHKISITGTRRVLISCQLRDHMDARFTRLWGYKDKYICVTDECGAATETKAVEENPSPKAKGFCDIFNESGWTPSPAEDRWAILEEFLGDNCLPKDTGEQEPFMELKRELERELKDLKSKLPKLLNPTDSEDPKCKIFDDCFDAHIERVSLIECYTPDCLIDSLDPSLSLSPHLTLDVISWAPGNAITFNRADLPPSDSRNHIGALCVTVELRGVVLSRVPVNGTVVNVMPRRTFDMLGYNQNDLSPCPYDKCEIGHTEF